MSDDLFYTAPKAPTHLKKVHYSSTSVKLSWTAPPSQLGLKLSYELYQVRVYIKKGHLLDRSRPGNSVQCSTTNHYHPPPLPTTTTTHYHHPLPPPTTTTHHHPLPPPTTTITHHSHLPTLLPPPSNTTTTIHHYHYHHHRSSPEFPLPPAGQGDRRLWERDCLVPRLFCEQRKEPGYEVALNNVIYY